MKKTLLAILLLLIALCLSLVLFIVGLESTRSESKKSEKMEETQKYREETAPQGNDYEDDAVSHDYKYVPEENPEDENGDVLDSENSEEVEAVTPEENADKWYRVRKSAGDASSQKGAFKDIERAKALAQSLKAEGYEVYDGNSCVYTP